MATFKRRRLARGSLLSRLTALCLAAASLSGCIGALPPQSFETGAPVFRPQAFFAGETLSSGVLETRSGAPIHRFHVQGLGRQLSDGSFRLDQTINLDQAAPRSRTWILRRQDEHHYAGALTDAAGPVEGEAYGDLFHLRYPMKTPVGGRMEQWLYLQPDGRTVLNEGTIRLLGVVVAHISERISRTGPSP